MKVVTLDIELGAKGLAIKIQGDYEHKNLVRSEGSVRMDLAKDTFELKGIDCSKVQPDILVLVGILAFYPALPTEHFTFCVREASRNLPRALNLPHILPQAKIEIDQEVQPYEPRREGVLSYGGGFDSLAAHNLFPDLPLVHESPLSNNSVEYEDVVAGLICQISSRSYVAKDNLRVLFTKWGLPLWVSVYIPSLLLEPCYIVSGSEMTGTYLLGGRKYQPRHANRWYDVFRRIGISILPTSFLSEIGNARVVYGSGLDDKAAYCAIIRNQDCGRCTKCLRRRAIRSLIEQRPDPLTSFTFSPEIATFLAERPLYYGDIFTHAVRGAPPTWLNGHLSDLLAAQPDSPFHEKYYPETFDHFQFPLKYRALAERRLAELDIPPFGPEDFDSFRNFQQIK